MVCADISENRPYRLGKMYFNIGNYVAALKFFRSAQKEIKSEELDQYIVDSYEELINQIHIEYLGYYLPGLFEKTLKELEMPVIDAFTKIKPERKEWFFSRVHYATGRLYLFFGNRVKADNSFIASLAYDPTNYKSLLWLVKSVHDEFPGKAGKLIHFVETFAGIVPKVEKDKTYQYLMKFKPTN
jgi:tetratricopeptide (TPR) repeat protein